MSSYHNTISYHDAVELAQKFIRAHSGDRGWITKISVTWDDDSNITDLKIDRERTVYDKAASRNAAIRSLQYDEPLSKESRHYLLRAMWDEKAADNRPVGAPQAETHGTVYLLVYILSHMGMNATRNDESHHKISACDAVAEAMRKNGRTPNSFSGVKNAFLTKRKKYHAAWNPVG